MNDKNFCITFSKVVASEGGKVYYVGGCVRDKLMGVKYIKDYDLEVYGILPEHLREIAGKFGEIRTQGASFGVLNVAGHHVDIAQPRIERANGRGHKDFDIYVDPFLSPVKAAMRRDFTMNSIMQDVLTGELLDPFGGEDDIKQGIIRHVRKESFVEDPLRVLRAAQFAARLRFVISPDTMELCRNIPLDNLPRERIAGELDKALLSSKEPSIFFKLLREMDQLKLWFPEISDMIGVPQEPENHPEGDVWNHSMLVLDAAADRVAHLNKKEGARNFLLAALCHDFGKTSNTRYDEKRRKYTAFNHDKAGKPLSERFIDRIYHENALLHYVGNLTELHMLPRLFQKKQVGDKVFMRMFAQCLSPGDLIELSYCDGVGRGFIPNLIEREDRRHEALLEKLKMYNKLLEEPEIKGKDLIELGYKPGIRLGEMLDFSHILHLSFVPKGRALGCIQAMFRNS